MARMGKAQTDLSKDSCGACGGSDYLSGALFIAEFAQSGDVGQPPPPANTIFLLHLPVIIHLGKEIVKLSAEVLPDYNIILSQYFVKKAFRVKDRDGGVIDKTGKYTAPETEGIYQIAVSSVAYPEVQASTFVIVRERE